MADQFTAWISQDSEDFETAGNWSNGVPDDNGDTNKVDVVISKTATASITENLDQSDVDLILNSLRMEVGSTVSVGGASNFLQCLVSFGADSRVTHLGDGSLYFWNNADVADEDTPIIYLDSPNNADALFLKAGGAAQNITNVIALSGFCSIASESFIHNLYTDYSDRHPAGRGPVVDIATASFAIEDVVMNAGQLTVTGRQMTEADQYGGLITFDGGTDGGGARIVALRQAAGTTIYKGSNGPNLVIGYGGVLDMQADYIPKTIDKYVHSTAHRLKADLNRITITQDIPLADTDTAI